MRSDRYRAIEAAARALLDVLPAREDDFWRAHAALDAALALPEPPPASATEPDLAAAREAGRAEGYAQGVEDAARHAEADSWRNSDIAREIRALAAQPVPRPTVDRKTLRIVDVERVACIALDEFGYRYDPDAPSHREAMDRVVLAARGGR